MKNRKLSSKAVISLILSAVLFTMPAVAFSVNGNYAISALPKKQKKPKNPNRRKVRSRHPAKVKLMSVRRKIQKTVPREARKKLRRAARREAPKAAPKRIQKAVPMKAPGMALYREMINRSRYVIAKINAVRMSMTKTVPSASQIISSVPIKTECEYQNQTAGGVA